MLPLVTPTANKSKRVQQEKLSMGKFFHVFLATAIVQLLLIQPSLAEPQTKNRSYHVLEIHSYHSGLSWTDSIIAGIRDTFATSGYAIQVNAEFLDARRYTDAEGSRRIRELISYKLKGSAPDVVIISDNAALEFALEQRGRLFPHTSVVFCGINNFDPSMIAKYRGITGVAEDVSIKDTVDTALRFHPGTQEIVVIGRTAVAADKANRDSFIASLPALPPHLKITFWDDLPMSHLKAKLEKLEHGTVVFINGLIADEAGRQLMYGETTQWICQFSPVPAYSLWDVYLGYGIVGGKLVSGYRQGKIAADMALRILNGQNADHLAVTNASEANQFMFDYRQLERFKISLSLLPKDAVIINQPDSFYGKYKNLVLMTTAIFLVLSSFILMLGIAIFRRRRAEEALRESEQRFSVLMANLPAAVFIKDAQGRLLFANRYLQELFGWRDCVGKLTEELLPPEVAKQMVADDRMAMSEGLKVIQENVRDVCGVERLFETHKFPVAVEGKPLFLGAIAMDITERVKAERELANTKLLLQAAFKQTPVPMVLVSAPDGMLLHFNQACVEMLGIEDEGDIIGQSLAAINPTWQDFDEKGKRIPWRELPLTLALQGITTRNKEMAVLQKNGTLRWEMVNAAPIYNEIGEMIAAFVVFPDITDRKQTEEALRESEEKYRLVVENASEVIFIAQEGVLTYVNRATVQILGYSEEEIKHLPFTHFIHPEDREMVVERHIKRIKGEEVPREYSFRIVTKDGSIRWMEIHTVAIPWKDKPATLNFLSDVTERKRVEEEQNILQARLQRAEKMEALGTLAGGVAHDLNNVLGVVVGYSELLLGDIEESSKIRSHVKNIMKGGERAAAIVQDLLTLARRGVQTRKVINLNTTINDFQETPEFMKLCSFHPDVQIQTNLETDLLNITGSPVHLAKTFFNLVSNAAETMPKGGRVTIRTSNEYLDRPIQGYDDVREGDYVVLSVSDTGEGIPAADLKRIFEPFYTKKVMGRSGTGLGLAVVWGTVKDHNGYINVQSQEGKGTTFTLYFPVTREEVSKDQIPVSVFEYMGNGESILVVDDMEGQRELASQMLKKLNYIVATVSSGEEALEYLKTQKTDIIVLDMIMDPGIDGLDTYKRILNIHPKQKAVIVSGFSETDRINQAQALGAGAYIKKPYVLEKLGLAVRKELDKP